MNHKDQAELQEPDPTRSHVHMDAKLIEKKVVVSVHCKVESKKAPIRVDKKGQ